jgi:ABC-type antimicrobial peptide transport system permease subunit
VLLKQNASLASAAPKIKVLKQKHAKDEPKWEMFIYPMNRWRLYSSFTAGVEDGGRITFVKLFGVIAIFILLIACINFMNLSTARSEKRAKEVGIRKVVGAQKSSLIAQFIGESIIIAFLAGILAIIIVQLCLPAYNLLTDKKLFIAFRKHLLLAGQYRIYFIYWFISWQLSCIFSFFLSACESIERYFQKSSCIGNTQKNIGDTSIHFRNHIDHLHCNCETTDRSRTKQGNGV